MRVLILAGEAPDSSESPEACPWLKGMGWGSAGTEHLSNWRGCRARAHTHGMKYIMLALFAVGCGTSLPPSDGTTDWSVTLGNWETPTCEGTMKLAPAADGRLTGSWACGTFGVAAHADIRTDGRVFLDLETSPGFLNGVRGTLADDDAIAGDILLDGSLVPFAAYRQ